MKTKLFLLAALAIALVACNEPVNEAPVVEGGWELKTLEMDKTVYADYNGNSHLKDEPSTREYKNKEEVWLFYDAHISLWEQYTDENDGKKYWSGYAGDAEHSYVVEGEGNQMYIIETSRSTIPGEEGHSTVTRYHVEKLAKKQMVLTQTDAMYVSDLGTTVDVFKTYTFKRENTLLDWITRYTHCF